MKFGKVIGQVVATRKTGKIEGLRLLVVRTLDADLNPTDRTDTCADTVNAGVGDIVLTCSSSSARSTRQTKDACVDNSVVAIVETVSKNRTDVFRNQ